MNNIIGILFFGLVVFIHELGHFLAAKYAKIKVEKFSIGFGWSLIKWMKNGTEYRISAIPLGGYVKLQGDELDKAEYAPGDFYHASVRKRTLLVAAGPLMNILLAYVLFFSVIIFTGLISTSDKPVIGNTLPKYPAAIAGLLKGDEVLSINGIKISNWYQMSGLIGKNPGRKVKMLIRRQDKTFTQNIVPTAIDGIGKIGIQPGFSRENIPVHKAVYYGVRTGNLMMYSIVSELYKALSGAKKLDFMGPIGIVQVSYETIKTGFGEFIFLIGAMSISIGLLNLFPIPVLDGGYILLNLIEAIRKKRATEKTLRLLNAVGLSVLVLIMVSASIKDFERVFLGFK